MKQDKQQLAKDIYLQTDKTQQEIADILSVDRKSVYLWMKSGKWEEIKIAARQTPSVILHNLYNHIEEVEKKIRKRDPDDRCPTMQEIEMLRKLIAMTKSVGGVGVGGHIDVYEELIRHARKKDVGFSIEIRKIADEVLEGTLINKDFIRKEEMQDFDETMKKVEEERAAFAQAHPAAETDSTFQNSRHCEERSNLTQQENNPSMPPRKDVSSDSSFNHKDHGPMGKNGEFSDPGNSTPPTPENTMKPATTESHEENSNERSEEKFPTGNFSANGEFPPVAPSTQTPSENNPNTELPTTNSIDNNPNTELPISNSTKRPSPFRDGNILWVNNINDVDERLNSLGEPWGERKMGDIIRYYPGMDPYERKNNAA